MARMLELLPATPAIRFALLPVRQRPTKRVNFQNNYLRAANLCVVPAGSAGSQSSVHWILPWRWVNSDFGDRSFDSCHVHHVQDDSRPVNGGADYTDLCLWNDGSRGTQIAVTSRVFPANTLYLRSDCGLSFPDTKHFRLEAQLHLMGCGREWNYTFSHSGEQDIPHSSILRVYRAVHARHLMTTLGRS